MEREDAGSATLVKTIAWLAGGYTQTSCGYRISAGGPFSGNDPSNAANNTISFG